MTPRGTLGLPFDRVFAIGRHHAHRLGRRPLSSPSATRRVRAIAATVARATDPRRQSQLRPPAVSPRADAIAREARRTRESDSPPRARGGGRVAMTATSERGSDGRVRSIETSRDMFTLSDATRRRRRRAVHRAERSSDPAASTTRISTNIARTFAVRERLRRVRRPRRAPGCERGGVDAGRAPWSAAATTPSTRRARGARKIVVSRVDPDAWDLWRRRNCWRGWSRARTSSIKTSARVGGDAERVGGGDDHFFAHPPEPPTRAARPRRGWSRASQRCAERA